MEILLRVFQRTILSVIHPVFLLPDHSRDLYCREAVSFNACAQRFETSKDFDISSDSTNLKIAKKPKLFQILLQHIVSQLF